MIAALILSSLVTLAALAGMFIMSAKEGAARSIASFADDQRIAEVRARYEAEACAKAAGDEAVRWRELHDRLLAKNNRRRVANESADTPETKHG